MSRFLKTKSNALFYLREKLGEECHMLEIVEVASPAENQVGISLLLF